MATLRKSSPLRAFCSKASSERCRTIDSSISLIVPFMPAEGDRWDGEDRRRHPHRRSVFQRARRTPGAYANPAVARQPRGLTRDHSANLPFANGGEQLLETGTRGAATRATEFVVDCGHLAPAQLPGKVGQAVLAALALAVVDDLVCRRLANVDDGLKADPPLPVDRLLEARLLAAILDRLLHPRHVLTIRGDSYRLRAKSGFIKPPTAGDGRPVGSASLRPVTGGSDHQTSDGGGSSS